jgi:hypothetical protein
VRPLLAIRSLFRQHGPEGRVLDKKAGNQIS